MSKPKTGGALKSSGATAGSDVDAFLAKVRSAPLPARVGGKRGRLIFAMDATMSRRPTWDRALAIQSDMFDETERIGGLDVQLVYFRGHGECRASRWVSKPAALAQLMQGVECRGGYTQIGKVLAHVKREAMQSKVNAAIFVGDAMEEDVDALCATAGEIGLIGIPVFMFQEGRQAHVEGAFREIARLTGGAYFRLDASSARMLGLLLSAVAVYAAGGRPALEARRDSEGAALLLRHLRN
jgi:hypothetical protein